VHKNDIVSGRTAPLGAFLRGVLSVLGTTLLLFSGAFQGQAASLKTSTALRSSALATAELNLVGLELSLPTAPMQLPQNAPFYVPVNLTLGGMAAPAAYYPAGGLLQGTLTGPGFSSPVTVKGTLQSGLSMPGLPQSGDFVLSDVRLLKEGQTLLSARPSTYTIQCLGEILLTSVTSSPMTMQEIRDAGIELQPGDYMGRRFQMALSVGGQEISLNVPVAIPVYNGLQDPRMGGGSTNDLMIGSITSNGELGDLSVYVASLEPPEDPFALSRPALSFKMRNGFKALLVIPGSIGYLKQMYRVNVVVFNALEEGSPYRVTNLAARWIAPAGLDGKQGTDDDPLSQILGEDASHPLMGPDGQTAAISAGESATSVYELIGNLEGSHPLDFQISGQFEGGGLERPVAISGTARGRVLVQNPNFNLMLVHPDVVRRGQTYTLEAHLTNTSQTIANAVSLSIDKARLTGAQLIGEATQRVDTLLPGESAVMKFQMQAFISGQVTSSYLYIDPGHSIGFQLTTGIGPRNVALNPDTLSLPESLNVLPLPLREAMLSLLNAAYDVATTKRALPPGVLPISRGTITTEIARELSQEGLFLGMGMERSRVWMDLWTLFMNNPDAGFDQLVRTTPEGVALRTALLDAWQAWPVANESPADLLSALGRFGNGLQNEAVVAIQGAGPGLLTRLANQAGLQVQGMPGGDVQLNPAWSSWGASTDASLQWAQMPMVSGELSQISLLNTAQETRTLKVAILNPVRHQTSPALNVFEVTLLAGSTALFTVGDQQTTRAMVDNHGIGATSITGSLDPEPFQVLGVHRFDLSVTNAANPYGTQVMVLFNRPNMPLQIPSGEEGFNAASALIQVEANQFWRKVMPPERDDAGIELMGENSEPKTPPYPAALLQTFPRVVTCYLEKPVGPYVQRQLTLAPSWTDREGHTLGGSLNWPIQSGLLPGGSIVRGHFRKLDGTGVPGHLTYWYGQFVNNSAIDLATGYTFLEEEIEFYYPVVTSNVPTDPDGSYQLDYVPAPIGDFAGPFVLQGDLNSGAAFAQASVLGNGGIIEMDLVLEGRGSVDGYIVDAQGQSIAGATVQAIQVQRSSDFTQGTGGGTFSAMATTDASGHYRVDGLKTGIFCLQVLKGELGAVSGGQITTDGQTVSVNVVLQGKVGTLKARILDPEGRIRMDQDVRLGIPGGLIRTASSNEWVYPREARPDSSGWVTFSQIPAGDVRLLAPYSAPTPAPTWQGYLNSDQTLEVELRMVAPGELATVRTQVVDASGNAVAGAFVKLGENEPYSAQTKADGYTDPVKIAPRKGSSLTGYVYHPDWTGLTATNSVMPESGASYVLKAVMPARCVLSGRVTRPDGSAVAGAYVAVPPVSNDRNKNRLSITDANGYYSISNMPAGATYRLSAVGPELLTSVNLQVAVRLTDSSLTVNLVLPVVGRNSITGSVFQPLAGNNQKIPTNATIMIRGLLPDVNPGEDEGNPHWGLPSEVITGGILEEDMLPSQVGQFSITDLPAGPFTLSARSSLFPSTVLMAGDFGSGTSDTRPLEVYLKDNDAGLVYGKVLLADGQTPVSPGARVLVMTSGRALCQVLTQPGGSYVFPKVIPPGIYALRVEDPQSGHIAVEPFTLGKQEVQVLNTRLWGTGTLTVDVQDSEGRPMLCEGTVTCGTVTLKHSKSGLVSSADLPLMELPLTPSDQGTLVFPGLLEGPVTVNLKSPNGLSGVASVTIPAGGGDQRVVVRLQPVGSIQGTLLRADGSRVAAGRVDAYQGSRWLGTSTTFVQFPGEAGPIEGQFMFESLPVGAIRLEAWDPDSRQVGQATVQVQADQVMTLTMRTLDTGPVSIQVLQEGQPVLRAGITVAYTGGSALAFTTQATADENGTFTFTLPPGTYSVRATDPVSLASGSASFTRGLNDPFLSETVSVLPVRSLFVTVLPPVGATNLDLSGWKVRASGLDRTIVLDSSHQGTLQDMPLGTYRLSLSDSRGRSRGSSTYQVTREGGALQTTQLQASAIGDLRVTVLDAQGGPLAGAQVHVSNAGNSLFTDEAGQAVFLGIPQGLGDISATHLGQHASGAFTLESEDQLVDASVQFTPTASLHGIVLDPLGFPVPFISVTCENDASATDAAGRFSFQGLPLQKSLQVIAKTAQGRTGISNAVILAEGDDPELTITLPAVGILSGRVTDPLRPSLPSMGIQILSSAGKVIASSNTDQTGAFKIEGVPAAQELSLRLLWDDGKTVALQQSFLIPGEGQTTTLDLQVPAFVNITGWTQDISGANHPMYVQLLDAAGQLLAKASTSIDIPTYTFRYLKAGQTFQLKGFSQDTNTPIALTSFVPAGQTVLEMHSLKMVAWPSLHLQLRHPDGSAAAGPGHVMVTLGTTVLEGDLGADGSGTIPSVPPGLATIRVTGVPNQSMITVSALIPLGVSEAQQVDIPVQGAGQVRVTLKTSSGRVLTGGRVWVSGSNTPTWEGLPQSDGSYLLDGVWIGSSFTVSASGFGTLGSAPTFKLNQQGEYLAVSYPAPDQGSLQGIVRDSGGTPVAGALVSSGGLSTTTDAAGAYRLNGLVVGTRTLLVIVPGRAERGGDSLTIHSDAEVRTLNLTLKSLGSVQVKTQDSDGQALPGQPVQIQNTSSYGDPTYLSAVSDATGVATFTDVLEGSIYAKATLQGRLCSTSGTLVAGGTPLVLTLKVRNYSTISGRIQRAIAANPWPAGTKASLGGQTYSLYSDGTLVMLEPNPQIDYDYYEGRAKLYVTLPSSRALSLGNMTLVKNGDTVLTQTAPAFGNLKGSLKNADGTVASGVPVYVDGSSIGSTDAEGLWSMTDVLTGDHHVTASTGNAVAAGDMSLAADGDNATLDLTLQSNAVPLSATLSFNRVSGHGSVRADGGFKFSYDLSGTVPYLSIDGAPEMAPAAPGGL
jgi:hypothetical protein